MKNTGIIIVGAVAAFLAIAFVVSQVTKTGTAAAANSPQANIPINPAQSQPNSSGSFGLGVTSILGGLTKLFSGGSTSSSPSPISPSTPAPTYGPAAVPIGVNDGQTIYAPAGGFTSSALNPATDPGTPPSLIVTDNAINLDYLTPQAPGIFAPGIATDTTSDYSYQVGTGSLLYA